MILEIDAGNTRIKWRTITAPDGRVVESGVVSDEQELMSQFDSALQLGGVRMGSVRGDESVGQLQQWVDSTWGISLQLAKVERECAGVSNHYANLSRLGVDRWLAMLAAFNRQKAACVIIDAGTAMTLDILDAGGSHQGGYILPGRRLMAKVLQDNTRIRLNAEPAPAIQPGHSTEAAVCNGIYVAQVALIEKVLRDSASESGALKLYLAGGDASTLADLIGEPANCTVEIVPDLVLDGLGLACRLSGD